MSVLRQHDPNSPDPLIRPMVAASDQLRRLIWRIAWMALCRWTPNPLHEWRCLVLRVFGARIGRSNFIYPSAKIWAPWRLETEDVVTISPDVSVYNVGGMTFGHHSIVSEGAYLCGASHDFKDPTFPMVSKPIAIGACAWVCARAVVLPGVAIGEGAVLGAAAVAARDLEAWGVYSGNPARLAGRRDPSSAPVAPGR